MSNNKRILLIMPYGSVGGMERLALSFYNYYKSEGYLVKALKFIKLDNDIINFGEDELFLKEYDFADMTRNERLFFYLKSPILLRRIIKKYKITHSISFGDMANIFSSLTYTLELKVGSIHALKSVELTNVSMMNKMLRFCFKTSFKNLNKLVCISQAIQKDLIEKCDYKLDNLEIIYNPHDLEKIRVNADDPITDIPEKEIFKNHDVILFLGRLSHQKSPWHLINSFYLLSKTNKRATLVFIGDGVEEVTEYCKKRIDTLAITDRVHFFGRKSNPYKYLRRSKLLALSSLYEGTPNVIVESIALGIPIVSSNCTGGIGELMDQNVIIPSSSNNIITTSGIITPNFYKGDLSIPDTEEIIPEEKLFSDAMKIVLGDDNFNITLEKNKEKLLEKFDLQKVSEKYLTAL